MIFLLAESRFFCEFIIGTLQISFKKYEFVHFEGLTLQKFQPLYLKYEKQNKIFYLLKLCIAQK